MFDLSFLEPSAPDPVVDSTPKSDAPRAVFEQGDDVAILHGDSAKLHHVLDENSVDAIITDPPAGIAFMGKGWDKDHGGRDAWIAWLAKTIAAAYRALKPGGHALVWALPRTSHWTATALENAGFEIRDIHLHLFGTGFPKSLNVSKAIDDALGATREKLGERAGTGTKTFAGEENGKGLGPIVTITKAATSEAAQWEGWGTALKPAAEHWILCRKPLDGTVAGNVLAHGTGGLNIEACRIGDEVRINPPAGNKPDAGGSYMMSVTGMPATATAAVGRWPAHVSLDEETAAILDEQSGGASRFFYVAKGARSEKDAGLEHLEPRTGGEATDREDGSAGLSNPRAGAGRTGGARNFHPTVKSIALMRWLVRLITPPGGIVLDPFAGSGSTGVAALAEGMRFIGCELTDEYLPILIGRIKHAIEQGRQA